MKEIRGSASGEMKPDGVTHISPITRLIVQANIREITVTSRREGIKS